MADAPSPTPLTKEELEQVGADAALLGASVARLRSETHVYDESETPTTTVKGREVTIGDLLATIGELERRLAEAERQRDEARAALSRINDVRNSIIGTQSVNWSAHIYPLVAALESVGIRGQEYDEAKADAMTFRERAAAAEARAAEAEAENVALRGENEDLRKGRGLRATTCMACPTCKRPTRPIYLRRVGTRSMCLECLTDEARVVEAIAHPTPPSPAGAQHTTNGGTQHGE